jgi:hypothetical protein
MYLFFETDGQANVAQHYSLVIIRVAQGMGVFDAFVESEGAHLSLQELSPKIEGDEKLLSMYRSSPILSRARNTDACDP